MVGCTPDEECRQDEHVRCKVIFALEDGTSFAFDSLTVLGVGNDSVLYDNAKNVSSLSLPLRADGNLTQFVLTIPNGGDTLSIYHTPAPYFVSMACGCFVYHVIDSVKICRSMVWEPEILNSAVQNVEQENIKLTMVHVPLP